MRIINKNTDGVRTLPLQERDLMQELTPASDDYGKVSVGTDGTYEGEVVLAKDIDVKALGATVDEEVLRLDGRITAEAQVAAGGSAIGGAAIAMAIVFGS